MHEFTCYCYSDKDEGNCVDDYDVDFQASGFCYINDIVIAILELLK